MESALLPTFGQILERNVVDFLPCPVGAEFAMVESLDYQRLYKGPRQKGLMDPTNMAQLVALFPPGLTVAPFDGSIFGNESLMALVVCLMLLRWSNGVQQVHLSDSRPPAGCRRLRTRKV